MRTEEEIIREEARYWAIIWYYTHKILEKAGGYNKENDDEKGSELKFEILKQAKNLKQAKKLAELFEKETGLNEKEHFDEIRFEMVLGKLSALRWALGYDWNDVLEYLFKKK